MKIGDTQISISEGNNKTGKIPSFSLSPVETCRKNAPCAKQCYAMKICRYSKTANNAYAHNTDIARHDPRGLENDLMNYFDSPKAPRFFRIHISGDFFSQRYFRMWIRIAEAFPRTNFLAFTKRYDWAHKLANAMSDNLTVVLSGWPGLPIPVAYQVGNPIAWMLDESNPDPRVPDDARLCPGRCDTCGACWSLGAGESVKFLKH